MRLDELFAVPLSDAMARLGLEECENYRLTVEFVSSADARAKLSVYICSVSSVARMLEAIDRLFVLDRCKIVEAGDMATFWFHDHPPKDDP